MITITKAAVEKIKTELIRQNAEGIQLHVKSNESLMPLLTYSISYISYIGPYTPAYLINDILVYIDSEEEQYAHGLIIDLCGTVPQYFCFTRNVNKYLTHFSKEKDV